MRRSILALCSLALLFSALPLIAQTSSSNQKQVSEGLPAVIASGLQAYKEKGADEAVKTWIKGSPVEGSKDALAQANNLRIVQEYYGAYLSANAVGRTTLSPKVLVVYLVLNFEKGPLFARFVVYKAGEDWITTSFDFNTKYELIFPSELATPTPH